jgi:hypothetical protein
LRWSLMLALTLTILLLASPTLPLVASAAGGSGYNSLLQAMGIEAPRPPSHTAGLAITSLTAEGTGSAVPVEGGYVALSYRAGGWLESRIDAPGFPGLPVLVNVVTLDGYVPADRVKVGVVVESFHIEYTGAPVAPVPEPLKYMPGSEYRVVYKPNPSIYRSTNYFPGRLVSYDVWHGLGGKTLIVIRFYPINYRPSDGSLVVVDKATIIAAYPEPKPSRASGDSVLILTSAKLADAVSDLVKLYRSLGYNVSIATVEYIDSHYKPAEPPPYPGFANPPEKDPVYAELVAKYNFNLSLKIIEFLRESGDTYSHIVIMGDAATVPPSYYFAYPIPRLLDPYNTWIPTDFFYASPDYDLAPNYYVGRIPFSDPQEISLYVKKLAEWYNSTAYKNGALYMSGGYPFLTPEMFGETALATMTYRNSTSNFYVNVLARTLGNYSNATVKKIFEGEAGALWYFALSHGNGVALADVLVEKTPPGSPIGYRFEILINTTELLRLEANPSVPIVSSVACMNAAWDEAVVDPSRWYFEPPSFGEAVLLSRAGGVAYLGSARVAWELLGPKGLFRVENGTLLADYYGASLLHEEILRAYNTLGASGATLGQVFETGLATYAAKAIPLYSKDPFAMAIALSEVFKATLLGDPAIKLPKLPTLKPSEARITGVKAERYKLMVNLTSTHLLPYTYGSMPLYGVPSTAELAVKGSPGTYGFKLFRVYERYGRLAGYTLITSENLTLPENGTGFFESMTSREASGLLLVVASEPGRGLYRLIYGAVGVHMKPSSLVAGSLLTVEAYGLDLLNIRVADLYVAGRLFASNVPVIEGFINWSAALPYLAPGSYQVVVYPSIPIFYYQEGYTSFQAPQSLASLAATLLTGTISVYTQGQLSIEAGTPALSEPGEAVIPIEVLYLGEHVNATLQASVEGPEGPVNASLTGSNGYYKLSIPLDAPGVYKVAIRAHYGNSTLKASGSMLVSITVAKDLYGGIAVLEGALEKANTAIESLLESAKLVNERLAVVNTSLGILLGEVKVINGSIVEVKTSLGVVRERLDNLVDSVSVIRGNVVQIDTKLGRIEGKLVSLEGGIAKINTSIGTLYINISKLVNQASANVSGSITPALEETRKKAAASEIAAISAAVLALAALVASAVTLRKILAP